MLTMAAFGETETPYTDGTIKIPRFSHLLCSLNLSISFSRSSNLDQDLARSQIVGKVNPLSSATAASP
jgi:hypothetical protein